MASPKRRLAIVAGAEPHLLSLDIHAPRDARDCAVLVYVHGGAWSFGDNPDELFLMGHSAGAYLVSLVATDSTWASPTMPSSTA